MGYGLGIFLLALGLILAFAVGDSIASVDLYTAQNEMKITQL